MIPIPDFGPSPARVLIVGDFASADDVWKQRPFGGAPGSLFDKMLHDAGILASECRYTLAYPYRPPADDIETLWTKKKKDALARGFPPCGSYYCDPSVSASADLLRITVAKAQPEVILAVGNFALWALTGEASVSDWRGSLIPFEALGSTVVIPVQHPRMIQKCWDWRTFAVRDLQRARDYLADKALYAPPSYAFEIAPEFSRVINTLQMLISRCNREPTHVSCDIETLARHISVIGLAWSRTDALVIPTLQQEGIHYWSESEEMAVMLMLRTLLTHPNCRVSGQNFSYDAQYFARYLGYVPNLYYDTMLMQHTLYPGVPKDLAFLSSMYCHHHLYWKDELTDYNRVPDDILQYWTYNAKDCCKTWEIAEVLSGVLYKERMWDQYDFIRKMWYKVMRCMLRGIRIDQKSRGEVAGRLMEAIGLREHAIFTVVDFPLNAGSPTQMQEFFYEDLKAPLQRDKKTKRPTCNDDALTKIAKAMPELAPLVAVISEKRSLGVFLSTFCLMALDTDGRMRTSYNLGGTETFRLSSSENAFGSGGNLQNIPKGDE